MSGVSVTDNKAMMDIHAMFVDQIRARVAALQEELKRLEAVEEYHVSEVRRLAGGQQMEVVTPTGLTVVKSAGLPEDLREMPKHKAAEIVLQRAGKPLRLPQIIAMLVGAGYGTHLERRMLNNALYTAMDRKPETFTHEDKEWGLVEWQKNGASQDSSK